MRSSVSVILSNPAQDSAMSHPDYRQLAHDHASLLILVRQVGGRLSSKCFTRIYDRLSKFTNFKVKDSQGNSRLLWIRYSRTYPVENNDWGDFQTHRRVLGLITIGQPQLNQEIPELCRQHESLKVKYAGSLYDSRCIVLGLLPDGSTSSGTEPATPTQSRHNKQFENSPTLSAPTKDSNRSRSVSPDSYKRHLELSPDVSSLVNGTKEENDCEKLDQSPENIPTKKDSLSELFLKVGPRKKHASNEDTPVSVKSISSTTSPTSPSSPSPSARSAGKSSLNSYNSYITSNVHLLFYPSSDKCSGLEQDWQEFIQSLFWVLESKRLDRSMEKPERLPLLCAPFERKDFVGLDLDSRTNRKKVVGRWKKQLGDLCLQAGLPGEALEHYQIAAEALRTVNDWLWLAAAFEGQAAASVILLYPNLRRSLPLQRNASLTGDVGKFRTSPGSPTTMNTRSLPLGFDPVDFKSVKHCLSPKETAEKYHEAVVHYSKYRNAGIVETEASIKAVHVLVEQRKFLTASEFLQNVVFINLQLSDEEKIQRFGALSDLYAQIGFTRKAAFFKRVAAMRCVAPQNPQPNWGLCYQLLLESLEGYKLSLDPSVFPKGYSYGWSPLQIQIFQELIGTARRLGNASLAIRHASLLLHALGPQMPVCDQIELAKQLDALTSKTESSSAPLVLDNGTIIPPVHWINLPRVKSVKLQNLTSSMRPLPLQTLKNEEDPGPFLFTPIQFGGNAKDKNKDPSKMDFQWVEGDLCEVIMQASNPAPFELKISHMCLVTEGIEFQSIPASITLPPESSPMPIVLTGTAKAAGSLNILGYSTQVLGIRSTCRLKAIPQLKIPQYNIEVVPALPHLHVSTSLPKSPFSCSLGDSSNVVASLGMLLYAGESAECTLTFLNTSKVPVEHLEVSMMVSRLEGSTDMDIFRWSIDNVQSQLPIAPGGAASLTLYIYGHGDFLAPGGRQQDEDVMSLTYGSGPASLASAPSGPLSLLSRLSNSNRVRRGESAASVVSVKSNSSARSGSSHGSRPPKNMDLKSLNASKVIEGLLKLKYSGGPGFQSGLCRTCSVSIMVDVIPSILITKWDVLPAETSSHCYLVLDVLNSTNHELELQYTASKRIVIEGGDSCRIPVPVERCPLSKLKKVYSPTTVESPQSSEDYEEVLQVCCDHLAALVDLRWHLSPGQGQSDRDTDITGKASLAGIKCTPAMLDLLRIAPIQFEVILDGDAWSPEKGDIVCKVGQILPIVVNIKNHLDVPLGPLRLRLSAFQDLQNGTFNYRLDTRLLITGTDLAVIPQISPQQMFSQNAGIAFFTSGHYKLEVQCTSMSGSIGTSPFENSSIAGTYGSHLWKLAPPIDLSVFEE